MAFDLVARLVLRDGFSSPAMRAINKMESVTKSIGKTAVATTALSAGLAAVGTSLAAISATKSALKLASDAEQANIAFTTMLGSAEKATAFMEKLSDFANSTPFELPQLRDASKKMLAFGFSADKVIPMLTAVGNAAAGLSLGSEGVDRLTLALGQMRAKGKVQGDEIKLVA